MISKILTYYAQKLEEFLKREFPQPEGVVEVGFIGNSTDEKKNKLIVSLLSIERETAGGINPTIRNNGNGHSQSAAPLHLNLNLILAAMYEEKRYVESLSVLSSALLFVQSTPTIILDHTTYTIEVVSPGFQELNNIWTSLGGQYYPSVLCKLRRVTFDASEVCRTHNEIRKPEIDMYPFYEKSYIYRGFK